MKLVASNGIDRRTTHGTRCLGKEKYILERYISVKALAFAAALSPAAANANVIWDFVETGISCANPRDCSLPTNPPHPVVAELTLPGENSSGTGDWTSIRLPIEPGDPLPVVSGDPFTLRAIGAAISPDHLTGLGGPVLGYHLSWTEVDSILIGIQVELHTAASDLFMTGAAALLATDGEFYGCTNARCQIAGSWMDAPIDMRAVPEPWSIGLLGMALASMGLWRKLRAC